jgi:hypothetical protein
MPMETNRTRPSSGTSPECSSRRVAPEEVQWLWYPRLPQGKLVLWEGDPDVGKTTVAFDLAARVSRGTHMPGTTGEQSPRGVVVLSAEDGLADTVVPRLHAAGADLRRIVSERFERWPSLDADGLDHIRRLIERVDARLVILDPMAAFIPDPIDTYRDHRVRRLLAPLMRLAEETGATIVLLRHLTKVQAGMKRNPHYAGGGSIAFTAAARVVLLAAIDPQDSTRRVLARVKGNLAAAFPALGYRLVPNPSDVVTVEWLGETSYGAEELLGGGGTHGVDQGAALEEAKVWLLAKLSDGPVSAREITHAACQEGIAKRTLERAKRALGVGSKPVTGDDGTKHWCWELPSTKACDGDTVGHKSVGDLGDLGDLNPDPGSGEDRRDTSCRQVAKDAKVSTPWGLATWAWLSRVRAWVLKKFTRRAESAETRAAVLRRLFSQR